ELDSLTDATEDDDVLTDDITGTHEQYSYFFFTTLANDAFTTVDTNLIQIAAEHIHNRTTQSQHRAARRVFFEAMMGFNNLDVIIIAEHLCRFAKQRNENIHTQARISRQKHRRAPKESFDLRQLLWIESDCRNDNGNRFFCHGSQIT